jgi:phage tail tape-measure protein
MVLGNVKRAAGGLDLAVFRRHMETEKHHPTAAGHLGQAAGGIIGVVAGAVIGVTAGPVGILLGGIAGAVGGWWAGRALAERRRRKTRSSSEL